MTIYFNKSKDKYTKIELKAFKYFNVNELAILTLIVYFYNCVYFLSTSFKGEIAEKYQFTISRF